MGHDDGLAQLRVQNAVGTFDGHQAAGLSRKGGVKGVAALRAGQGRLRLRRAREKPPQNVFNREGIPPALGQTQHLARFGVGKDNLPGTLQKHQHG
jgi:hypothetical protein